MFCRLQCFSDEWQSAHPQRGDGVTRSAVNFESIELKNRELSSGVTAGGLEVVEFKSGYQCSG